LKLIQTPTASGDALEKNYDPFEEVRVVDMLGDFL
jgi:hypothetical protein